MNKLKGVKSSEHINSKKNIKKKQKKTKNTIDT